MARRALPGIVQGEDIMHVVCVHVHVIPENGYPLDSSDHYMLWLVCLVLVRHDDLAVGNGINRRGLLDKSIEQLAPGPGLAPVEGEGKFVEIVTQMFATDPPLVRAEKPSFQQRGHQMDAGKQFGGRFHMLLLDDTIVNVAVSRQSQVAIPLVGSKGTAWLHHIADEATQLVSREVADHPHPCPTDTTTILLDRNDHQRFILRPTSNVVFFPPPNVGFIDLDQLLQAVPSGANHCTTQLVKPSPGGFIAPQPQGGLQPGGASTRFLTGHPPHGVEPHSQRLSGVLKDRPRRDRDLTTTRRAVPQAPFGGPSLVSAALGTAKPVRPAQPGQILTTGLPRGKHRVEFHQIPWILLHTPKHYMLGSLESRG